jgi:protein ImuA
MQGARQKQLQDLRDRIAALETGPVLRESQQTTLAKGLIPIEAGVLSEIFADDHRDTSAALGFSLGLARGLLTPARSAIIFLQLMEEAQETGVPYGNGLLQFGLNPDALVLARPKNIVELLWAMEEAIACHAVAAVIADIGTRHKALDFTASRRLSLRSAAVGTSSFIIRYARDREASAARYRWRIAPAPSGPQPYDARAPGPPRWRALLEKGRLRRGKPVSAEGEDYFLDWTKDGFVLADSRRDNEIPVDRPALPRSQPAALGHRLSQAS